MLWLFVLIFVVFAILNTKYKQTMDSGQEAPLTSKNNVCLVLSLVSRSKSLRHICDSLRQGRDKVCVVLLQLSCNKQIYNIFGPKTQKTMIQMLNHNIFLLS